MSDIEARLAEFRPFTEILGRERAGRVPAEDIAQEALIAVWTVLQKRPDAPRSYLIGTAKNRANGAAIGRLPFGGIPHRGKRDLFPSCEHTEALIASGELE